MNSSRGKIALILALIGIALVISICLTVDTEDSSAEDTPVSFWYNGLHYQRISDDRYWINDIDTSKLSKDVTVSDVQYEEGVLCKVIYIGSGVFKNVTKIETLVLSGSLTSLNSEAFSGCTNLESVAITTAEITTIEEKAFKGCIKLETVTFVPSNKVTDIGEQAFKNCEKLTDFTISFDTSPEGQMIMYGDGVFSGCSSLVHVTTKMLYQFDDSLDDDSPFAGCVKFEGLRTSDENGTTDYGPVYEDQSQHKLLHFPMAMNVSEYTFSESLEEVLDRAFDGTKYLTSVIFPQINKIAVPDSTNTFHGSFTECTSIQSITISFPVTNGYYTDSGILYNDSAEGPVLCRCPADFQSPGVSISNEIKKISDYAFYNCTNVKSLTFDTNLSTFSTIGDYAFSGSGLQTFAIGDDLGTSVTLGIGAFKNCVSLESFDSQHIRDIPEDAFRGCTSLITLNLRDGLETIGKNSFNDCTSLSGISMPNTISDIYLDEDGEYTSACTVFRGCTNLRSIKVDEGCSKYIATEENGPLYYMSGMDSSKVIILYPVARTNPSCVIVDDATGVAPYAFYGCTTLLSVTIMSTTWGTTSIRTNAFYGCTSLAEVNNRSVAGLVLERGSDDNGCIAKYVKRDIFLRQSLDAESQLYTVDLSGVGSCHFIVYNNNYDYLLRYAGNSTAVVFPESVISKTTANKRYYISADAFLDDSKITKITFSSGIVNIEAGAFNKCTVLETLDLGTYTEQTIDNTLFVGCYNFNKIIADNSAYKSDSDNKVLFSSNGSILVMYPYANTSTSYIISATTIGEKAFYNCENLREISISITVRVIEREAFMNCTGLTEVTIPIQVTEVQDDAFIGCMNITKLTIPASIDASVFPSITNLRTLHITGNGSDCYEYDEDTVKLTPWYKSNTSAITVTVGSDSTTGLTTLKGCMFYGCTGITSVTIMGSVSSVGDKVFYGNVNLQRISIPITLDTSKMSGCTYLTTLTFTPGVGDDAGMGHDYDATTCLGTPWYASKGNSPNLIFETGVLAIGEYMFGFYDGTATMNICATVTEIGSHAFFKSGLKSVVFASDSALTLIGPYAFSESTITGYVSLPVGLRTIQDYAFKNCKQMTSINIPKTVIDDGFGTGILNGCINLSTMYLPVTLDATDLTDTYSSIISIRLTVGSDSEGTETGESRSYTEKNYQKTVWYLSNNLDGILIDDGVTTIGAHMFHGTTTLESISVGTTLLIIGDYAFADCINMSSFGTLLTNVTTIGAYAFRNCAKIDTVSVSDSIISIGEGAFAGCTGINTLSTPININASPFKDCKYLENVRFTKGNGDTQGYGLDYTDVTCQELPWYKSMGTLNTVIVEPGVIYLGDYLLYNCNNVATLTFAISVEHIGDYTFGNCFALSSSLTLPQNLVEIGDYAFYGCSNITAIELPDSIQHIGDYAFYGCTSVNELQFPIYVNATAFYGCFDGAGKTKSVRITRGTGENAGIGYDYDAYTSTMLPWTYYNDSLTIRIYDGITSIGSYTFYKCKSLLTAGIPATVTSIGEYAFGACSNLDTVIFTPSEGTEVSLSIGDGVFCNTKLESITIPDRVTSLGAHVFEDSLMLKTVTISDTSGITSMGEYAFAYTSVETLNIPANVACIESYMFYGSSITYLTFVNKSNLSSINGHAFEASKLTSFVIPDTIGSIGEDIFKDCNNLSELSTPVDINLVCLHGMNSLSTLKFTYGKSGKCLNYFETGLQSYKDLPWNSKSHSNILTVEFSAGITYIGENMFNGAKNLISVKYDDKDGIISVIEIGKNAFMNCTSIDTIEIPNGVLRVGDDAFFGCTSVTYVSIPESVERLGDTPFRSCSSIYNIEVAENNPVYVSDHGILFDADKSKLIKFPCMESNPYVLPQTVSRISAYAFEGCRLSGITLGEETENGTASETLSIGAHAFENCKNLSSLIFPLKVNLIGEYAFHGCISVKEIKFYGESISMDNMSFALGTSDYHVTCDVYSPSEMTLAYYTDSNTTFNYHLVKYRITFSWNTGSEVIECERGSVIKAPNDPEPYDDSEFRYVFSYWDGFTEGMTAESDMEFRALYDAEYIGYISPIYKKTIIVLNPNNARTVTLSESTMQNIKDDVWNGLVSSLEIYLTGGNMKLDANSLYNIDIKKVTVSIEEKDNSELPESIAKTVGDRTVYSVEFGDIHQFYGTITVTVGYTLHDGEREDKFIVWHMNDDGSYTEIKAVYSDNTIRYDTSQLSYFAIAQIQDEPQPTPEPSASEGTSVYTYVIIAAAIMALLVGLFIFKKHRR